MSTTTENLTALADVLKTYWGYDRFLPLQPEAMACVMEDRDSLVVLPTGGGKSVCFQIPAMLFPGITIVISPLIALMKDQVDGLNAIGIPASTLNSSMPNEEQRIIINRIQNNEIKLLYVAPERLIGEGGRFLDYLKQLPVSLSALVILSALAVSAITGTFGNSFFSNAICKYSGLKS